MRTPEALRSWITENDPAILVRGDQQLRTFEETGCHSEHDWTTTHWRTTDNPLHTLLDDRRAAPGRRVFQIDTADAFPALTFWTPRCNAHHDHL